MTLDPDTPSSVGVTMQREDRAVGKADRQSSPTIVTQRTWLLSPTSELFISGDAQREY